MFTKQTILADIEGKVLKVVSTVEETDVTKNEAGVRMYMTHVMEQSGETVSGRNIGWYTINEGEANEEAFYRDLVKPKNTIRDVIFDYLKALTPTTFIRFTLESVNEETKSAYARVVVKNQDGVTASEKRILVFKNAGVPMTHIELTS